jgi:UDP-N-acetylmuramoylalanine--D-glutamate ligase
MLKNCEKKVFIGGNIGISPLTFVDELDENSYTIIEMSSFQLQGLDLKPDVAVVLPIGVDHLDYHEDETEYRQAKANIARSDQDGILVLPYDGETKESFLSIPESNKYYYEKAGFEDGVACGIRDGLGYCKRNDREYFYDDLEATVSKLKIPKENLLAALTCLFALDIGVDLEKLTQNFERLPLRIEFVGEKSGKKYYNDSAATNPVSTIEACNLMDEDFVLIAGGSSKGLDYSQMASKLAKCEKLKAVLLIGDTGKEIDLQLDRAGYAGAKKYLYALSDCLKYLDSLEIPYGAVLFSPASASFDQYKDYKHRGEEFNRLINV